MAIAWTRAAEWTNPWSGLVLYKGDVTTDGSGDATGQMVANGFVVKVAVVLGTATGLSLVLSDIWDGDDILDGQGASLSATKTLFPQLDGSAGYVPVVGGLNAVVSGGGDTKTATLYVWVRQ